MALSRSGVRAPYPPLLFTALLPPGWCVSCVLFSAITLTAATSWGEPKEAGRETGLQRFADVRIDEKEALRLIEHIRRSPPGKDEAATLVSVANSGKYSDVRRRRAILQLFDRNVPDGMTLGDLADLLKKPSWLKRENILEIAGSVSNHRSNSGPGSESAFCLTFRLPPSDASGVYLRIKGSPEENLLTKDVLLDTLQGRRTDARRLKIVGTVVYPGTFGDLAYVRRNFDALPRFVTPEADPPRPRWPRHWEIEFSTDHTEFYARELDYFMIELGMLRSDNTIVYAYHLSKSKPDTRVLDNPALKEKRYYLTCRDAGSSEADRKLLARAGIQVGNRLVLKFLPPPLEANLINLERRYREAMPRDIARTRFGVRAAGSEFSFFVLEQSLK
jgi:hypothetical protein